MKILAFLMQILSLPLFCSAPQMPAGTAVPEAPVGTGVTAVTTASLQSQPLAAQSGNGSPTASTAVQTAGKSEDLLALGLEVHKAKCAVCHAEDKSRKLGPGYQGLFGSIVKLASGKEILADEAYLIRSIKEPASEIKEGYPAVMPPMPLTEQEIKALIALIKSKTP